MQSTHSSPVGSICPFLNVRTSASHHPVTLMRVSFLSTLVKCRILYPMHTAPHPTYVTLILPHSRRSRGMPLWTFSRAPTMGVTISCPPLVCRYPIPRSFRPLARTASRNMMQHSLQATLYASLYITGAGVSVPAWSSRQMLTGPTCPYFGPRSYTTYKAKVTSPCTTKGQADRLTTHLIRFFCFASQRAASNSTPRPKEQKEQMYVCMYVCMYASKALRPADAHPNQGDCNHHEA